MAKVWKKLQRADGDYSGNVTGTFGSKSLSAFYRTDNKPTKTDVGLGNVTNESKTTMFASPVFTGTPSGISKSHVGLGNVGNTSVADIRSGVTKSDVGLANVENFSKSAILSGTFTGDIGGTSAADIKSKAVAGEAAKSAVDGSSAITMVGGSLSIGTPASGVYPFAVDTSGNLKIKNDEFQALADGTVNCKGNFTINQDSNGDSKIVLAGDSTGTAEVEVNGANPTFDLGGASPLGTSSLYLRRKLTSNQARIQFRTGDPGGSNELNIGVSNNTINGRKDQYAIHYGPIWSSGTAPERGLTFDHDGKMGMYANTKTVAGFTFGSDGTNKHVYIKDGGMGIGTTSISDDNLNVAGTVTANAFSGNGASLTNTPNTTYTLDLTENNPDVTVGLNPSTGSTQYWNLTSEGSIQFNTNESTRETSVDVAEGSITTARLESGSVTSAKIANGAVTGTQLSTYAVNSSAKLGTGVVTTDKINANAVTPAKANLGWHTQTKIFVPPSAFTINDDNQYGNLGMVDNGGQARVMYANMEAYANVPIPSGYKVTHWRVNGTASVTVSLNYSTIATSTTTSAQAPAQQFTNNTNVTNPSAGISADDTNGRYMVIGWFPSTTAQYLFWSSTNNSENIMAKEKLTSSNLLNLTSKPTTYKTKAKLAHMYKADDTIMSSTEDPISNNIVDVVEELRGDLNKLHDDVHHMYKMVFNAFGSAESEQWSSQGATGAKGSTGAQGPAGTAGAKGATGSQGPKGDTGSAGSNGTNGSNGAKGDKGDTGSTGAQGPKGDTGSTGPQGATGSAGAKGDKGDTGDTGPAGSNGTNGSAGAKGDKGDTGNTGPQGATGPTGSAGAKGDKGDTGSAGSNGTDGSNGAKGDTGNTGATGAQGPAGSTGATGPQGATGAAGSNAAVSGYDGKLNLVYNSKGQTRELVYQKGLLKSVK